MDEGDAVVILRCARCGDTFPASEPEDARCPTCGGSDVSEASEPLL